jgi:hypothetical protein
VHAFDFIMLFFSFIFALALTHLLLAVNAIIQSRRRIKISVPHAIWMFNALLAVSINWISPWDFHDLQAISLSAIVGGFVFGIAQYLVCVADRSLASKSGWVKTHSFCRCCRRSRFRSSFGTNGFKWPEAPPLLA